MFLKDRLERRMSMVQSAWSADDDSPGGGGYNDVTGEPNRPGGGVSDSTDSDFAGISSEIQKGYEDAIGRAASEGEKSWIVGIINGVSALVPGGFIANALTKGFTGKTIGGLIGSEVKKAGVYDPYEHAAEGSSFTNNGIVSNERDTTKKNLTEEVTSSLLGAVGGTTSNGTAPTGTTASAPTVNAQGMPSTIPGDIAPGLQTYVDNSNALTHNYNVRSDSLWDDYLDFENTYFNKFQDIQDQYQSNLDSIPKINLKMPGTMGGAVVPLAPKAHSTMYGNQANTMADLVTQQGNTALSGMSSRNALNQNAFNVGQTGLTNALMPTNTALDLYKMERASQLGLNNALATADANKPSTLSTWAPVVGSLLSTNDSGKSNISSVWDFVKDLF